VEQLSAQARSATDAPGCESSSVRYLRSIFVPEHDLCFFLYQGPSAAAVRRAAERAGLVVAQVRAPLGREDA
jgi:Protein of unknown function (DUF4242)